MENGIDKGIRRFAHSTASLMLWKLGAIKINLDEPFKLAGGNYSPIYVDCRLAVSYPALVDLFCMYARHVGEESAWSIDAVAGGETAGIPFAAFISRELSLPMIYVRKKEKGHGTRSRIEGVLPEGASVLLVEDMITDGGSKLGFIDAIEEAGAKVEHCVVILDRGQGGDESLADRGVKLHSLTTLSIALSLSELAGALSKDEEAKVKKYLADPAAWHGERGYEYHA